MGRWQKVIQGAGEHQPTEHQARGPNGVTTALASPLGVESASLAKTRSTRTRRVLNTRVCRAARVSDARRGRDRDQPDIHFSVEGFAFEPRKPHQSRLIWRDHGERQSKLLLSAPSDVLALSVREKESSPADANPPLKPLSAIARVQTLPYPN
jgi:hypothetical protein